MKKQILSLAAFATLLSGHVAFAGKSFLNCAFNKGVTLEASSRENGAPEGCVLHPKRNTPTCGYTIELPQSLDVYASGKAPQHTDNVVVWNDSPQTGKMLTLELASVSPAFYKKGIEVPVAATYAATFKLPEVKEALRGTCTSSFVQN